jgi:UDP-N-acetylmuramate--alanine ligase
MTNIDHEHLENYGGFDDLQQAFVDFANKVPFYGAVIACADDPNLTAVLPRMTRRVITYGLAANADVTAIDVVLGPLTAQATVKRRARSADDPARTPAVLGSLMLNVPGRHNLQNALAAVAVGLELGLPFERVAEGLLDFRGAERRFEVRGEPNGILIVDDYGHHPTEIAAALAAAKGLKRRIVVAFQPHRYTRTARLMDAFGPALAAADHIVLTDIYAAGEDPIPGVTLDVLAAAIRRSVVVTVDVVARIDDVVPALLRVARPGDVVMTLGAGSIGGVPEQLIAELNRGGQGSTRVEAADGERP